MNAMSVVHRNQGWDGPNEPKKSKWTKKSNINQKWTTKNRPKMDQKWTKNGPNFDQNGHEWTKMNKKGKLGVMDEKSQMDP